MGKRRTGFNIAVVMLIAAFGVSGQATAQLLEEDFESVTGSGGGLFLDTLGFGSLLDWDDGILGEAATGQADGFARVEMAAQGLPTGGVDGSGGAELSAVLHSFNLVDEDFDNVTGTGGGVFLTGDGVTPNLTGSASSWDNGIEGEKAFFVTRDGAVLGGTASATGLTNGENRKHGSGRAFS